MSDPPRSQLQEGGAGRGGAGAAGGSCSAGPATCRRADPQRAGSRLAARRHALLHRHRGHRQPVVRWHRRLHLPQPRGLRGLQREAPAGQALLQRLRARRGEGAARTGLGRAGAASGKQGPGWSQRPGPVGARPGPRLRSWDPSSGTGASKMRSAGHLTSLGAEGARFALHSQLGHLGSERPRNWASTVGSSTFALLCRASAGGWLGTGVVLTDPADPCPPVKHGWHLGAALSYGEKVQVCGFQRFEFIWVRLLAHYLLSGPQFPQM